MGKDAMSEANMWQNMRVKMGKPKHWLEATRHEDKLQSGISDVSFITRKGIHGWMELKHLKEYPKRESTIIRIEHYTPEQRQFLRRKGKRGGYTFLFVQIERDYYLFDWHAAQNVGYLTRVGMVDAACGFWTGRMDWRDLGRKLDNCGWNMKI